MIFLDLYLDQFHAHLMNIFFSLHKRLSYDLYDLMIYEQERV